MAKTTALEDLDNEGLIAKIKTLGDAYSTCVRNLESTHRLSGKFLATCSPEELDQTLKDLGVDVENITTMRWLKFALGFSSPRSPRSS